MVGLSPYLLGGAAISIFLAFGGGYWKGNNDAANRYQVKIDDMQIEAADRVQKVRDSLMAQANAAVASLETKNENSRIVYHTITQQVDKLVQGPEHTIYLNTCFDADGIMLANAALAGPRATSPAPRNINPGMSRPLTPQ